jgi:hypothetical protein
MSLEEESHLSGGGHYIYMQFDSTAGNVERKSTVRLFSY